MRSASVSARLPALERSATSVAWARRLAVGVVAVLVAASVLMAAGLAAAPNATVTSSQAGFPGWLAGPLQALDAPALGRNGHGALLLIMAASYLALLGLTRVGGLSFRLALGVIVGLDLLFLLAPPTTTDLFGYIGYAKLPAVYGLNPYTHGAGSLVGDPVHPWLIWHNDPSPYGPLFTVLCFALVPLSVPVGMWTLKVVGAVCALGIALLVGRIARATGRDPVPGMVLVALNPLILVYGVGGAHNDVEMMVLALGAVGLALARRDALAGAAGAAAVGVKATVLAPLLFLTPLARDPRRALLGAAAAAGAIVVASLIGLGPGMVHAASALASQGGNVSPVSPVATVAGWFGVTGHTALHAIADVALVAGLAAVLVRALRGGDPLTNAAWAAVVLLLATTWLMTWYLFMLLPLAAIAPSRAARVAALAITGFLVYTHVHLG